MAARRNEISLRAKYFLTREEKLLIAKWPCSIFYLLYNIMGDKLLLNFGAKFQR